ncbi:hypothetical protein TWF694_006143 [Orbilia ellipsospora]|uniref:Uncharacterized protein n=1 Tax=Orbilia ellipsospora TaxID=2528407 RepID=A0AAV9WSG0_9PEZI
MDNSGCRYSRRVRCMTGWLTTTYIWNFVMALVGHLTTYKLIAVDSLMIGYSAIGIGYGAFLFMTLPHFEPTTGRCNKIFALRAIGGALLFCMFAFLGYYIAMNVIHNKEGEYVVRIVQNSAQGATICSLAVNIWNLHRLAGCCNTTTTTSNSRTEASSINSVDFDKP